MQLPVFFPPPPPFYIPGLPLSSFHQLVLIAKLGFQLHFAGYVARISPIMAQWYGFYRLGKEVDERSKPTAWLVQWEIFVIVCVVLQQYLSSLRITLWPGVGRDTQLHLFDESKLDRLQCSTGAEEAADIAHAAAAAAGAAPHAAAASAIDEEETEMEAARKQASKDLAATGNLQASVPGRTQQHERDLNAKLRKESLRWTDVMTFHINHFLRLHGVELCNLLSLVVALVRLNFLSIVYFVFFLLLGTRRRRPSRAIWGIFLMVQAISLIYQYACALGLPPTIEYPWQQSSYSLRVLIRWAYLPLTHVGEWHQLPRAPGAWRGSDVLYADFALLFASSLLSPVLGKPTKAFVRRSALLDAGSAAEISLWRRNLYLALPWLCWTAALLAVLSRPDVLCIVYLALGVNMYWNFASRLVDPEESKKYHRRLQRFAAAVVFIHLVWVLPAVAIHWDRLENKQALVDLAQVGWERQGLKQENWGHAKKCERVEKFILEKFISGTVVTLSL